MKELDWFGTCEESLWKVCPPQSVSWIPWGILYRLALELGSRGDAPMPGVVISRVTGAIYRAHDADDIVVVTKSGVETYQQRWP